jgi:8-oxo-dGTP pyrophosphatase MutT (NUDIX family)
MKLEYSDDRTPVVRVVAQRQDGKILVCRKEEMQKWELPGGKIEQDENRFEAGIRELKEETGLDAENFVDLVRVEIEDENGCANAFIVYTEVEDTGAEPASHEHDRVDWVRPDKYRELDFHYHSAYSVPSVERLETYLENREI